MDMTTGKKKIFVGVSGGVDSSVSAALLKEQGHDVTGVFIRTWQPDWIECTWKDERRDAMRVCAHLEIPFVELDLEQEYKQGVADYMIAEYRAGRTPNPDVMCNKEVKFGGFLKWALEHGADAVATGHYAQNIFNEETKMYEMHKGKDQSKDQSYFLWTLTQEQLVHVLFPVGHLEKSAVRELAEKFELPTATKKDSQGICFIGKISMKDFLGHYIDEQSGNVIDTEGNVIGTHTGALFFTLGERHGFTITKKGTDDQPYYVVAKNVEDNTITVSQDPDEHSNNAQELHLENVNWASAVPNMGGSYTGQIRYHGEQKPFTIAGLKNDYMVIKLDHADSTIAAGQSFVMYHGTQCLGGGVIQ